MLEILAPAGNEACALAAINSGADAVYLGLPVFSARQSADNFSEESFSRLILRAHACGVKVYVAMNTLVKDSELPAFFQSLLFAWNAGADAVILQDLFLGKTVHAQYPQIVLHASTQAGICTAEGAILAKEYGFSRVILARETPLAEIKKIAEIIETEVFVQGALCTCFSGQCYFSSFIGGNSGNRGRCKQPCRKLYAYDRRDNTEKNYALSLSDLSVGEQITKLIAAGVTSFKIEGRMRRAEYVAAAVSYYRALLDGKNGNARLSDLKRTYNRGNYTQGLSFGQDKRLLSTAVQGHLGEKVGVVSVRSGEYVVESAFRPQNGDAFKILRDGKEVGGATYAKSVRHGFVLTCKARLKNGDGVFITTDTALNARLLQGERKGQLTLSLRFCVDEPPVAECPDLGVTCIGDAPLQAAKNQPLTEAQLQACFAKTDALPVEVAFAHTAVCGDIFIPKGELNAFRRLFYTKVAERLAIGNRTVYTAKPLPADEYPKTTQTTAKTAVIATDFADVRTDIAVFKLTRLGESLPRSFTEGNFEKYLYYPALATEADIHALRAYFSQYKLDGVYIENYGGFVFAARLGIKIFVGTGLNLSNRISISAMQTAHNVRYFALSKELNEGEGNALCRVGAFALSNGNIKLMDLCYCPFGKTCGECDKRAVYRLTDENGREFPVRRYLSAENACRFEVFNCADLVGTGLSDAGKLVDCTLLPSPSAAVAACEDEVVQKSLYQKYTSGHFKRGVL